MTESLTIKNLQNEVMTTVNPLYINNYFAVHEHYERKGEWCVTHCMSGLLIHGPKGTFKTPESAIKYADQMDSAPILWNVSNKEQFDMFNDVNYCLSIADFARLIAESSV